MRDFADNQYLKINQRRKHFVHNEGYENKFSREFLESDTTSLADMLKLKQQREELPAFLKEQMFFCVDGYFKAMDFLNELNFKTDANTKKITYSLTQVSPKRYRGTKAWTVQSPSRCWFSGASSRFTVLITKLSK